MPVTLMLLDIWKDGRLLLNRASWRRELTAILPIFLLTARLYCLTKKVEAAAWRTGNPVGLVMPCTCEKRMALRPCFWAREQRSPFRLTKNG
jgi:hypothetical protein